MILAVVDGRQNESRGMTQREMAELMRNHGASFALNLDGGGSSTMVTRPFYEKEPKVINSVSGGVQRLISNAIGIFAKSSQRQCTWPKNSSKTLLISLKAVTVHLKYKLMIKTITL